jgi:putative protein-disulfide isomerase
MGPAWVSVARLSGMPIDEGLWRDDPPASSYPAAVAVKAAGRQGEAAAEAYLRRLREAAMLERRNIARREVLSALADELAPSLPGFDPQRFARDLGGEPAVALFREDLKEVRYLGIARFPTLVLGPPGSRGAALVGYRPWTALAQAIAQLAPGLAPLLDREPEDPVDYARAWGRITAREVADGTGLDAETAERALDRAVAEGRLARQGALFVAPERAPATERAAAGSPDGEALSLEKTRQAEPAKW